MLEAEKPEVSIQKGLGTKNSDGNSLKNIWLELPGYCNLACSYCYAEGGVPARIEDLLSWSEYENILEQAKNMGVEDVGIPGAGEPFLKRNKELTFRVLEKCRDLGFYITLFSHGQFIDEEIADRLYSLPVEIMIKVNSLDPGKQDLFVSDFKKNRKIRGYGQKRNEALKILMNRGFNDEMSSFEMYKRKSRMAIVTSVMTNAENGLTNYEDMAELLRFSRDNNIMFDVDSVLKRGRGSNCNLCEEDLRLKNKLQALQKIDKEEYGVEWELSQSYIGTACDRYSYHMYIDQYGEIRPCIGAMDVKLGNVKMGNNSLEKAWNSKEMQIVRARNYKGKCVSCANFTEPEEQRTNMAGTIKYKCNSCLGRRTENLTNEFLLNNGYVFTIGCWNHRPKI